MKKKHVFLPTFKPSEFIFNEEETKEILKFFFKNDHAFIDGLIIHDRIRSFAQAILVEAVDTSFAIGFVKIIYDTFLFKPPTPNVKKIFIKFGSKAARHWFKHAKATDLKNIKIYDFVRDRININFHSDMVDAAMNLVQSKPGGAIFAYDNDNSKKSHMGLT